MKGTRQDLRPAAGYRIAYLLRLGHALTDRLPSALRARMCTCVCEAGARTMFGVLVTGRELRLGSSANDWRKEQSRFCQVSVLAAEPPVSYRQTASDAIAPHTWRVNRIRSSGLRVTR